MPLLQIPDSGLSFESVTAAKAPKTGSPTQDVIGLTLTDDLIEQMIQCVQNGKPIQLSLGPRPNLSFGNTTQQLSSYQDSFPHELYHHNPSSTDDMKEIRVTPVGKPHLLFQKMLSKNWKPEKAAAVSKSATNITKSVTAGVDNARETLEKSMALEKARKEENTTRVINAALDPKRGALKGGKSKFLATPKGRLNDTTRSLPSSPALSGIGSPLLAPTSVPTSQLLTEQAKSKRKAIVHLLALRPMSETALREKVDDLSDDDFKQSLNKVADKNQTTSQYELLKNYYKELDVWSFNYDSEEDRQVVIDNAIKQYDRLRIPQNDDEWERLKPIDQRGDGKSLSKVQARIAQGPIPRTPKISVSNADSGRDTPGPETEEPSNKTLAKVKNDTKRSSSQPPNNTTKPKRLSEKEAQSKRLLSTKKKPAVTATSSTKKESPTKASAAKPLSNQFVTESDDEEASKPIPPVKRPSPGPKRPREDEASSDSSQPLMKKVRPSHSKPVEHRASDAHYSQSSASTFKSKGTSPQKSSPLASSPPTNASDFASSSASDASTPRHHTSIGTKIPRSPIHKRNASSSSLSTNSSTSSTMSNYTKINPNVMQLAAKFRCYYPTYAALHRELSGSKESERDMTKHEKLLDMHERLVRMKKEIKAASLRLT